MLQLTILCVHQVRVLKKGEGRQLIHAGLNESHKEYHYVLTQVWRSFSSVLTLLLADLARDLAHAVGTKLRRVSQRVLSAVSLLPQRWRTDPGIRQYCS